MSDRELIDRALEARRQAYTPYSGYQVGAALACRDGTVYTGSNIENASYSVCNCAERTALFRAVHDGHREFTAIAVAGGPAGEEPRDFAYPCGVCRQALSEFSPALRVIVVAAPDRFREFSLRDLLPSAFGPAALEQRESETE